MKILAYNPGHDGAAVSLEDGRLRFAVEVEKDDGIRHGWISPTLFLRSLEGDTPPDALAVSGWLNRWPGDGPVDHPLSPLNRVECGYMEEGVRGKAAAEILFAGRRTQRFSSSHVRSHIMCTYGLSPFPAGQPCYALIWEGAIGAFYHIDENVEITKIADVLGSPGARYQILYVLADPGCLRDDRSWVYRDDAGKVMALAAYGREGAPSPDQQETLDRILALDVQRTLAAGPTAKALLSGSSLYDIGVERQEFKDVARLLSMALFDRFYNFAKEHLTQKLPLLIGGGCGLNCDWNTQWRDCGLFPEIFVPPCPNDSGVALGAAVDALHHYTGQAKVEWSVYAGDEFVEDVSGSTDFHSTPLDLSEVCRRLLAGDVIAWAQGRYEMGPRALGNRSLLAAPFSAATRDKLNRIKQREPYRPVAPICLEEDFGLHFDDARPSPYMLHFQRVKSRELAAITHVDGSARGQSVNDRENPAICALLREFRRQSGVGVLCNTSLNFKGRGFINRMSQLLAFAREHGVDGIVAGKKFWRPAGKLERVDGAALPVANAR